MSVLSITLLARRLAACIAEGAHSFKIIQHSPENLTNGRRDTHADAYVAGTACRRLCSRETEVE
jgi:hypothetical protein